MKTPKLITIDLSELYNIFSWKNKASTILRSILDNADIKILILVNESPDTGIEIDINKTMIEGLENVLSDPDIDTEKYLMEIANKFKDAYVVKLDDGYETAYALVSTR